MEKFEYFKTIDEARQSTKRGNPLSKQGWRNIHTDKVENEFKVTWTDAPENIPQIKSMTELEYTRMKALQDGILLTHPFRDKVRSLLPF